MLSISSEDGKKIFNISYFGFTELRKNFLLSYSVTLYNEYNKLLKNFLTGKSYSLNDDFIQNHTPNELLILINHSDVDGELTSSECEKLLDI